MACAAIVVDTAVLGAAVAFAILNFRNSKLPKGALSLFAFDVISMMEPMTLLGTSAGVKINKMVIDFGRL
jgi:hypothetical protein